MKEIWKDIENFEGLYQVSNLGRVKSVEHFVDRVYTKQNKIHITYVTERDSQIQSIRYAA